MSSKKPKSRVEHGQHALAPKLRFPEFLTTGEWKTKSVGAYLVDCTGRVAADTELPIYSSTREGLKRQDAYFDGSVLQNTNDYGVVPAGCFVYRHMSDDGLFKFNINGTGGDIAVSKEYPVFRTKGLNSRFLLALLNDGLDFKRFAYSQKAGGTRTRLYFSRLCDWRTPLPSVAEQQKIANCLTSLDELIAAQACKVDALKTLKKGLMQRLFPREGETQPRLRFPEFEGAGDWLFRPFDDFVTKSFYGTSRSTSEVGEYPVLRMGNMSDGKLIFSNLVYLDLDRKSFEKIRLLPGDILMNRTNSQALVGKISMFDQNADCITASYIVAYRVDNTRMSPAFCNLLLNTPDYQAKINAMARPSVSQVNINPTTFRKELVVSVPSLEEQQHIADCLTAFDSLISAVVEDLESLKTHKTGLMQQLFPSAEALNA